MYHNQGSKGGAVVRALASRQCGPGSNPGVDATCGLSLLLVLSFAPRGFSPGTPVFPSPQKLTLPNSNSIWTARKRLNELLRTQKCFVGKHITMHILQFYNMFESILPVISAVRFSIPQYGSLRSRRLLGSNRCMKERDSWGRDGRGEGACLHRAPRFPPSKRLLPRVIVCHFLYWWHPMPIKFKLVRKLFRWTLQNCLLHKTASWLLSTINLAQLVLKAQVEADVDPMVQASLSCFRYRFLSCKIKRTDSIIIYASSLAKVVVLQR